MCVILFVIGLAKYCYNSPNNGAIIFQYITFFNKKVRVLSELSSQTVQVISNDNFLFILQVLNLVRVQCFSKRSFFSLTRTQNSKKSFVFNSSVLGC